MLAEIRDLKPAPSSKGFDMIELCFKQILRELRDVETSRIYYYKTKFIVSPRISRVIRVGHVRRLLSDLQVLKDEFKAMVSVRVL